MKRVAILFSGRGSNMLALLAAMRAPDFGATPALLVCDKPNAEGIASAKALGFDTLMIDGAKYPNRNNFDAELHRILTANKIDLVCLAGFMRILGEAFVNAWQGRVLNIHPSLLPKYKGLDTHRRALAAGDGFAGASVHLVNGVVDGGRVLAQSRVAIEHGDTENTLAARVLEVEHTLYPAALRDFLQELKQEQGTGN